MNYSIPQLHSAHSRGSTCPGAQPAQTNCHILRAIISSWGQGFQLTWRQPRVTPPKVLWEKLGLKCWCSSCLRFWLTMGYTASWEIWCQVQNLGLPHPCSPAPLGQEASLRICWLRLEGQGTHPSLALARAGGWVSSHPDHGATSSSGMLPQEILTSPETRWPQAWGQKQEPRGLSFVLCPANLSSLWLKNFLAQDN